MNRRKIKQFVIDTLGQPDLNVIYSTLKKINAEDLVYPLFSSLCHTDELVRWHGISVLGKVVRIIGDKDIEDARVIMRRFLWMLNDESGGIGWGVPEAMAEAMVNNETLAEEYFHMLVSYTIDDGPEIFQDGNFLELPLLQRGVLWGMCRVASKYRNVLDQYDTGTHLLPYFQSEDTVVVGLACCLVEILGIKTYSDEMKSYRDSKDVIRVYVEGTFYDLLLKEIVKWGSAEGKICINPFLGTGDQG